MQLKPGTPILGEMALVPPASAPRWQVKVLAQPKMSVIPTTAPESG